jgi:thiol-disulfide isomerase/thioredoxin
MNGVYYLIFSNGRILRNEEPNEMVMTLLSRKFFNLKTDSDKVNNRDKMSKRNAYDSIWGPTIEYRLYRPQGNMSENFHSPYFKMNEFYILAEKDSIPIFFEQTMSIEGGFDQLYSYRIRKITQLDIVETDSIFNFYQTLVSIGNTNNANITETLYKQPNRNYSNLNSLEFFDLEGQKVQIINPNQLTLVKFWYIGCLPCMSVIPMWNELFAQFEHRNVSFVSINSKDNSTQKIKHFLNKREIKGIHIHDLGEVEKQLGVKGYPTIILINLKGEVVREWIGTNSSLNDELIETINLELYNR